MDKGIFKKWVSLARQITFEKLTLISAQRRMEIS